MDKFLTESSQDFLNLSGHPNIGLFLIIAVNLYSYIDSDVRNIQKIKYFHDYFRPLRKLSNMI